MYSLKEYAAVEGVMYDLVAQEDWEAMYGIDGIVDELRERDVAVVSVRYNESSREHVVYTMRYVYVYTASGQLYAAGVNLSKCADR